MFVFFFIFRQNLHFIGRKEKIFWQWSTLMNSKLQTEALHFDKDSCLKRFLGDFSYLYFYCVHSLSSWKSFYCYHYALAWMPACAFRFSFLVGEMKLLCYDISSTYSHREIIQRNCTSVSRTFISSNHWVDKTRAVLWNHRGRGSMQNKLFWHQGHFSYC